MRILIVTPAPPRSRKGNRITALRWARLLRELGHRVALAESFFGQPCDLLIAMHAKRSAASIREFHDSRSGTPLIVALTGTDLYRDIKTNRAAQYSLELADRLLLLQPAGVGSLPTPLQAKARVIQQSATGLSNPPPRLRSVFEVAVIGHLRPVKDPFRAAMAARTLPASSRIRVVHIGAALSEAMAGRTRTEMVRNPRYQWIGELSPAATRQRLARARLLVLSSRMEGGANVISEAIAVGTPIIASKISGSIGLLGEDYPGYFEVGDTSALRQLLQRAEEDSRFYGLLQRSCRALLPLVKPRRERDEWERLISEFV
ncbi:MAG: selenoneine biosynthesis selenosugar synthase SenB [Planctomycetota bacterium]|nr:selenoneine biosynthesis selenosugar synthase SenB [Planctomycetota bacterium]